MPRQPFPAPAAPRPSGQRRHAAHLVAFLTLSTALISCGRQAGERTATQADSAVPVRVTTLNDPGDDQPGVIAVTGTLAGKEEVALAFKVGGIVSRITVDPGQSVRAGQVLAEVRPTEIAAQVANAQEARRKAERDLARVSRLYEDSVATLEQLQDARTGLDVAVNSARIAQFNAEYAVIRAPGDGVVLTRLAEPGQVIEPGRTVLMVRRNSRGMVVRVGLSDRDAVRLQVGDSATVVFDALPGQVFAGRVTQRGAAASAGTGNYAFDVTLGERASALPTGLVARVELRPRRLASGAGSGRVMVPLDALVDADADSAAVFVLRPDGGSVSRRTLKLTDVADVLQSAQVPVASGLAGREQVVTAGMSRLVDGSRVRVVTTEAQRANADAAQRRKVGQ